MTSPSEKNKEITRLETTNDRLKIENEALHGYLAMIKELVWAGHKIVTSKNLLYALNQLLYKVMATVNAHDSSISRLDETGDELVFILVHGELGQQLPEFRIKSDTGIAGWVVKNGKSIIVNNPREDERFSQIVDTEFSFFTQSIVSVPIINKGKVAGVIQFLNKRGADFSEADVALLLVLAQVAAIVFKEIKSRPQPEENLGEGLFYP